MTILTGPMKSDQWWNVNPMSQEFRRKIHDPAWIDGVGILPKCNPQKYQWVWIHLQLQPLGRIIFLCDFWRLEYHNFTLVNFSVSFCWFVVKTITPLFMVWSFSITTVMIGKDNEAISISKYGPLQGRGSKFTQGACYLYARSVTFWLKSCFTQKFIRADQWSDLIWLQ